VWWRGCVGVWVAAWWACCRDRTAVRCCVRQATRQTSQTLAQRAFT
jgi:hypothetical protein